MAGRAVQPRGSGSLAALSARPFALKGNLVYFAALKNHIGFYPTASGIAAFTGELSMYEGTKGAVRFPINQPLPLELISKIVQFRVTENLNKAAAKARKKKTEMAYPNTPDG